AISAGLVYIKKEGLLDRMFVRPGLDIDAILEKDVGGAQNVFARIKREGYVVQASFGARVIARVSKVIAFVCRGHPHADLGAIVEHNLLGQHEAEIVLEKFSVGFDVDSKPVEVIDASHVYPARRVALRLILEGRLEFG